MKSNSRQRKQLFLYFFAILGTAAVIYSLCFTLFGGAATVYAQQDPFLSQRLNRIEQRFTTIESKLAQLEQQARFPTATADITGTRASDLRLIRAQFDTLQLKIAETECGLLKLDERTLTPAARTNRRNTRVGEDDICRQSPNAPLQLSARP
jgi:hypothetical protein